MNFAHQRWNYEKYSAGEEVFESYEISLKHQMDNEDDSWQSE